MPWLALTIALVAFGAGLALWLRRQTQRALWVWLSGFGIVLAIKFLTSSL